MLQRRSFATASASSLGAEMLAEEVHAAGLYEVFTTTTFTTLRNLTHKLGNFVLVQEQLKHGN